MVRQNAVIAILLILMGIAALIITAGGLYLRKKYLRRNRRKHPRGAVRHKRGRRKRAKARPAATTTGIRQMRRPPPRPPTPPTPPPSRSPPPSSGSSTDSSESGPRPGRGGINISNIQRGGGHFDTSNIHPGPHANGGYRENVLVAEPAGLPDLAREGIAHAECGYGGFPGNVSVFNTQHLRGGDGFVQPGRGDAGRRRGRDGQGSVRSGPSRGASGSTLSRESESGHSSADRGGDINPSGMQT